MSVWIFLATHSGFATEAILLSSYFLWKMCYGRLSLRRASIAFIAFLVLRLFAELFKFAIVVPRPCWQEQRVALISCPLTYSFPSGHAVGLVMAASLVGFFSKRRLVLFGFVALALVVSWSRVIVGVHTPVDSIAGSALGLGFGWVIWRLFLQ